MKFLTCLIPMLFSLPALANTYSDSVDLICTAKSFVFISSKGECIDNAIENARITENTLVQMENSIKTLSGERRLKVVTSLLKFIQWQMNQQLGLLTYIPIPTDFDHIQSMLATGIQHAVLGEYEALSKASVIARGKLREFRKDLKN